MKGGREEDGWLLVEGIEGDTERERGKRGVRIKA